MHSDAISLSTATLGAKTIGSRVLSARRIDGTTVFAITLSRIPFPVTPTRNQSERRSALSIPFCEYAPLCFIDIVETY